MNYYHSHFLAATIDFTSFFIQAFLGLYTLSTTWLYITSFCNGIFIIHQSCLAYGQLCIFLFIFFLYYRSDALLWYRCCMQNLTVFLSHIFIVLPYTIAVLYFVLKTYKVTLIIIYSWNLFRTTFNVVELYKGWFTPWITFNLAEHSLGWPVT